MSKIKYGVPTRGYCGYFEDWYLRSLREFRVAKYLKFLESNFKHIKVGYEINYKSYSINGRTYKPDFYIFKNGVLKYIIEVKSNKQDYELYNNLFYEYFTNKNIKYIVTYSDKDLLLCDSHSGTSLKEIEEWKINSIQDYSGKNNPAYGCTHSEKSKRLIGDKTLERNKDEEWKKYHSQQIKKSMTKEAKKNISESRNRFNIERRRQRDISDPLKTINCECCGNDITKRLSILGDMSKNSQGCSYSCTVKLRKQKGIYKNSRKGKTTDISKRLINDLIKIGINGFILENDIQEARKNGKIAKNSPLSEKTLMKYFKTNNTKEIIDGEN